MISMLCCFFSPAIFNQKFLLLTYIVHLLLLVKIFVLRFQLLCGIGVSSRECLLYPDHALNEPGPCPENVCSDVEYDVIDSVLEQDASVKERVENDVDDPRFNFFAVLEWFLFGQNHLK